MCVGLVSGTSPHCVPGVSSLLPVRMSPEQLSSQGSGFLLDYLSEYLGAGLIEAECGVVLTLWCLLSPLLCF